MLSPSYVLLPWINIVYFASSQKIFKKGISIKKGVGSEFAGSEPASDASYLTMLHTVRPPLSSK
jgi:hypothetical protein